MKKQFRKKSILILLTVFLMTVLCSCIQANTEVSVKRSGKATVSACIMLDEVSLRDKYGMPTNFYDAVEKDARFAGVVDWKKEYTDQTIDGVNYTGVKISKEVPKKEIANALSTLYGNYANATYRDKNNFGSRTIYLELHTTGSHLMAEELQEGLSGGVFSTVTISVPGKIKSVNGGTKQGESTVVIDAKGLLTGEVPSVSMEAKFNDYTFFIPIGIVVALAIAAIVFVTSRLKHNIDLKKGSSSIKLEKKKASSFADPNKKPEKKMSFTKPAPKYTPTEPSVVAPAPTVVKQEPARKHEEPVYEEPAYEEPQYEEPVYEEPAPQYEAPVYEEPAPQYEEPVYEEPAPRYEEPAPAVETSRPRLRRRPTPSTFTEEPVHEPFDNGRAAKPDKHQVSYESVGSSGAIMHQTTNLSTDYSAAGSAKFSPTDRGTSKPASTGSTIFTPRSTAPNLAYGQEGYIREEHEIKETLSTSNTSTLFTPRSTAPNMDYYEKGHQSEKDHEVKETLSKGSTLFTPRSTAPNMDYGVKKDLDVEDSYYDESTSHLDPFYDKDMTRAQESTTYTEPQYEEAAYEQQYEQPQYEQSYYEEPQYEEPQYEEPQYEQSYYEEPQYEEQQYEEPQYEQSYYEEPAYEQQPAVQPIEQGPSLGSIYSTNGYEASAYQSANSGASEKSAAIKEAYGGSKLGSGAYVGGGATGMKVGRSVGNIGGYVDETMVNTSSYGSDPFAGNPLPKLGESGYEGGGLFAIGSAGGFGASSYEGNTIGEGTFGSSKFKYTESTGSTPRNEDGSVFAPHSEVSSAYGKRFNTGGSGKFDFSMASGDSGRKCPFCKEPIRDDDLICVACGATLSRPYGSL